MFTPFKIVPPAPRLLVLVLIAALAGCASNARGSRTNTVNVMVENSTVSFITVWAVPQNGTRVRVGDVPANQTVTLSFSPVLPGPYIFVAEQLSGSRIAASNPVSPLAGETVRWNLTSNIATVGA
jgi:hypothetical protein